MVNIVAEVPVFIYFYLAIPNALNNLLSVYLVFCRKL